MNKRIKAERGITLIALVVTIVVLLILAAITIPLLLNGGIIDRAKEGVNKYKDAEDKEREEIDEIIKVGKDVEETGSYTIRVVSETSGESLTSSTLELYDSSYNFIKLIQIDETGIYDGSSEELPIGTYYLNVLELPYEYNYPTESIECKILPNIINEWEVSVLVGSKPPSTAGLTITYTEDEVLGDYDRSVVFNATGPDHEDMDGGMIFSIYEVATFNETTGKYEYNEEFRDIISTPIRVDNYMNYEISNQIISIIRGKGLEPIIADATEGNPVSGLRKGSCYIVIPQTHIGKKYIITMCPILLPFALMNACELNVSWSAGFEIQVRHADIEITNAFHNTHVDGASETFVYKVTGYLNGEEACSKIASMPIEVSIYDGIQKNSILVELLMVPDEIEVEQIYGGTCFTCATPKQRFELGEDISSVEFSNESTRAVVTGSVLTKTIIYDETEETWGFGEDMYTNSEFAAINCQFATWRFDTKIVTNPDNPTILIRMKIFTDEENGLNIDGDGYWTQEEDEYFHYNVPLEGGEETEYIYAQLNPQYDEVADGSEIHTVMIVEVAEAKYREDGTVYADWNTDINE